MHTEYRKCHKLQEEMLTFLRVGLATYGTSYYDVATDIIFVLDPTLAKSLLTDLRDLIERFDRSIFKKEERYFTVLIEL
jgi:hypothetical protein